MKESVLVVDDMPIIRDPIAATLATAGFDALSAGNGKQALEMLRTQRVDLVLLDVNMPVMDGLSFLRILRQDESTAKIPVIMLSGAEDRQDVIQAAKLGIQGYILKSHFSLKDLLGRVTQHFESVNPKTAPTPHTATPAPSPSADIPPQDGRQASIKVTAASRSEAPGEPVETTSLNRREQCVNRAKRALNGRTLSGIVAEMIALATHPKSDASDLASLIARDPLLTARILQVANSAAYASRGAVLALPDAIRNIGSATVRNVAAALGVFNAMPPSDLDGFNQLQCWQHAFAVASLCARLATEDSGLAYLVGLCHDLGEVLFRGQCAAEYRQVIEIQKSTGKPRDLVEKQVLGATHAEVLQTIVKCLDLPRAIVTPIQEYQSNGAAGSGGSPLTRVLRAADLYANGMFVASSSESLIRPITCAEAKAITGNYNPPRLDRVVMRDEIVKLTALLSRFSDQQQSELMTAPYAQRPIHVWLARDPTLSSFDPVETALGALAQVTAHNVLPTQAEATEHQAIIVMARSTSASGFTATELNAAAIRPNQNRLPVLWLVGRIDGDTGDAVPSLWPISLAKLAEFVTSADPPPA